MPPNRRPRPDPVEEVQAQHEIRRVQARGGAGEPAREHRLALAELLAVEKRQREVVVHGAARARQ